MRKDVLVGPLFPAQAAHTVPPEPDQHGPVQQHQVESVPDDEGEEEGEEGQSDGGGHHPDSYSGSAPSGSGSTEDECNSFLSVLGFRYEYDEDEDELFHSEFRSGSTSADIYSFRQISPPTIPNIGVLMNTC